MDLDCRKRNGVRAKALGWQPRFVEKVGVTELEASQTLEGISRADNGSLVDGNKALRIQLKDFGNKYACPGIEDISRDMVITFLELYTI